MGGHTRAFGGAEPAPSCPLACWAAHSTKGPTWPLGPVPAAGPGAWFHWLARSDRRSAGSGPCTPACRAFLDHKNLVTRFHLRPGPLGPGPPGYMAWPARTCPPKLPHIEQPQEATPGHQAWGHESRPYLHELNDYVRRPSLTGRLTCPFLLATQLSPLLMCWPRFLPLHWADSLGVRGGG